MLYQEVLNYEGCVLAIELIRQVQPILAGWLLTCQGLIILSRVSKASSDIGLRIIST